VVKEFYGQRFVLIAFNESALHLLSET